MVLTSFQEDSSYGGLGDLLDEVGDLLEEALAAIDLIDDLSSHHFVVPYVNVDMEDAKIDEAFSSMVSWT